MDHWKYTRSMMSYEMIFHYAITIIILAGNETWNIELRLRFWYQRFNEVFKKQMISYVSFDDNRNILETCNEHLISIWFDPRMFKHEDDDTEWMPKLNFFTILNCFCYEMFLWLFKRIENWTFKYDGWYFVLSNFKFFFSQI